jgi:hypothetical protein
MNFGFYVMCMTVARRQGMMREVTGAFFGSRKLDEALEDLRAEGIAGDRVRVADMTGFADFHACMNMSTGAPTQWITAEEHDYRLGFEASDDDILPVLDREEGESLATFGGGLTRVVVSIRDDAEFRAVCDIFSRLGTDDIDA